MNNAVVGGAVALVIGLSAIGAYVYVEQQKLRAADASASAMVATPTLAPAASPPSAMAALGDLYGIPATTHSVMISATNRATVWFAQTVADGADQVHVVFVGRQDVDAKGELANSSRASSVPLDAITYKLTAGKWQPAFKQSAFAEAGSWGELYETKPEVARLGNAMALLIESIGTGQGYTYVGRHVFALEPIGWKELGVVNTGADNAGACEEDPKQITADSMPGCWSYSGTITAGPVAPGKAYPDITVMRVGTMADDNRKVVPATPALVRFEGPRYAEME